MERLYIAELQDQMYSQYIQRLRDTFESYLNGRTINGLFNNDRARLTFRGTVIVENVIVENSGGTAEIKISTKNGDILTPVGVIELLND